MESSLLPDVEKEQLCRTLLAEFGVTSVNVTDKGEMIHSCPLPFGLHSNNDKNASASLNYKRLTFNCFTCGGGGLLWFIGICRGTSSVEARRWLETETGAGPEEQPLQSLLDFFDAVYAASNNHTQPIPHMDPRILDPWMRTHPYLTEVRHIPEDTLERFSVGYAEIPTTTPTGTVASHRVVIPHFWSDQLVGWQSRRLTDDGTPKYKSTPDFPKDTTLFNHHRGTRAIVVESPMSVLRHAHHLPLVATFGAELTDRQIRHLTNYDEVILAFDNDKAGWRSTEKVGPILESYGPVRVLANDYAADVADFDDDTISEMVNSAVPYSLWTRPQTLNPW